tara:strand:+ start:125 stop:1501 length:1377 start_codon:yes stop_codon:yes gene_type:complete
MRLAAPLRALATMSASISRRIADTDAPVIVGMQQMLKGKSDVMSMAQGIVHWPPPSEALQAARAALDEPQTSLYCADDGLPALRDALKQKLARDNGLVSSEVMVTAGANQAYTNVVLSLLDAGDAAVLYRPYYFNHLMALQMTGSAADVVLPPSTPDMQPDLAALQGEIEARAAAGRPPIKLVTLVNPGNPTGVMIPRPTLEAFSAVCEQNGIWLVLDNTYEHFAYEGEATHSCLEGEHIINVFSFSKAYGMMGWRVGYAAFPPSLGPQLFKTQDTIVICPTVISQKVAIGALETGRAWVDERIASLAEQKALVLDALHATLGADAVKGGSGAIYLFCRLPAGCEDDTAVVVRLPAAPAAARLPPHPSERRALPSPRGRGGSPTRTASALSRVRLAACLATCAYATQTFRSSGRARQPRGCERALGSSQRAASISRHTAASSELASVRSRHLAWRRGG